MESESELFIVFGGGCFGTHHVRSIEKGRQRGRISKHARIVVVDRNDHPAALDLPGVGDNPLVTFVKSDWLEYMKANWDTLPPSTQAVPAPIAPHLAFEWLAWSLQQRISTDAIRIEPMAHEFGGLPYEYLAPTGCRYISAANWTCPLYCRAPRICPMTRGVRDWELAGTLYSFASSHSDDFASAVVFEPRFLVPGIDRLYLREYLEARDRIEALAREGAQAGKAVLVGTVSPCHGAVSMFRFVSLEADARPAHASVVRNED